MLLKYKTKLGWIAFYLEAIKNRLRIDLNLSDLSDKQAARDNLELSGDNNHTHYHDDRYIPLIDGVKNDLEDHKNSMESSNIEIVGDAVGAKEFNVGGTTRIDLTVNQAAHADNADEAKHALDADNATLSKSTLNIPYGDKGGNIWIEKV